MKPQGVEEIAGPAIDVARVKLPPLALDPQPAEPLPDEPIHLVEAARGIAGANVVPSASEGSG